MAALAGVPRIVPAAGHDTTEQERGPRKMGNIVWTEERGYDPRTLHVAREHVTNHGTAVYVERFK